MRQLVFTLMTTLILESPALASDGVLEINQVCAVSTGCFEGDAPGFPVTIAKAGSYRLTGALDRSQSSGLAVEIPASPVSLDLNGFSITGNAPILNGTGSVRLQNGTFIALSGGSSLAIALGSSSDVVGIRSEGLVGWGLSIGSHCIVRDSEFQGHHTAISAGWSCHISGNVVGPGGQGEPLISAGDDSVIERNMIRNADGWGIATGLRSKVSGNVTEGSRSLGSGGIAAGSYSVITENSASGHRMGGISCGDACVLVGNTANINAGIGIRCGRGCQISNNTANGNGILTFDPTAAGIKCGGQCSIKDNVSNDNLGPGLLDAVGGTAYSGNQFSNNNGGNANPQVSGGIDAGGNICGGDAVCP